MGLVLAHLVLEGDHHHDLDAVLSPALQRAGVRPRGVRVLNSLVRPRVDDEPVTEAEEISAGALGGGRDHLPEAVVVQTVLCGREQHCQCWRRESFARRAVVR